MRARQIKLPISVPSNWKNGIATHETRKAEPRAVRQERSIGLVLDLLIWTNRPCRWERQAGGLRNSGRWTRSRIKIYMWRLFLYRAAGVRTLYPTTRGESLVRKEEGSEAQSLQQSLLWGHPHSLRLYHKLKFISGRTANPLACINLRNTSHRDCRFPRDFMCILDETPGEWAEVVLF